MNWYRHHLGELRTVDASDVSPAAIDEPRPQRPTLEVSALARARAHHPHGDATAAASSARRSRAPTFSSTSTQRVLASLARPASAIPDRDYLFLSKGHDVPALYGTLAELGFIDRASGSRTISTTDDSSTGTRTAPCRASSSTRARSAISSRWRSASRSTSSCGGTTNRVFVVLGDGELDEGSVWEACSSRPRMQLDNLVAVVDRNEFQANIRTEELIPLEPLAAKFEAFGAETPHASTATTSRRWTTAFAKLPLRAGPPERRHRAHGARQGAAEHRAARRPLVRALHARRGRSLLRELHGECRSGAHTPRRWWCDDELTDKMRSSDRRGRRPRDRA